MIGWSFHGFQTSLSKATHYPWVAREGWHAQERAAARYNDDKNICRRLVPRGKPEHYSYFIFPLPSSLSSFSLILVPTLFLLALSPVMIFSNISQFQREQKSKKFCRNKQVNNRRRLRIPIRSNLHDIYFQSSRIISSRNRNSTPCELFHDRIHE